MTPVLTLAAGILAVLAITVVTAYFVAQEFAYMAVDRSRLGSRAAQGDQAAERTLAITRRTSFMLSGAQLGITVTGLLVGYVAEPLIGESLASMIGGGSPEAWAVAAGGAVAISFATVVQMVLGELLPKNYAIARAEHAAIALAPSTRVYLAVLGPVIWVFDKAAEGLLRLMRMEPVHDVDHSATARDLEHVVEESRSQGSLSPELSVLLDRILDFPHRDVEHAVVPRPRVDAIAHTATVGQVRTAMAQGHSRYPVLRGDHEILGVVHLQDVLCHPPGSDLLVTEVLREPIVLAETMSLPDALAEIDSSGQQLACVVDEFGGFAGILTLEDLAEEIVGELTDEHDPDDLTYEPTVGDGVWVMDGTVHLDEVERSLGVDLPRSDVETIAGLVIQAAGGLPEEGDIVPIPLPLPAVDLLEEPDQHPRRLQAEVLAVESYVPARIRLTLPPQDHEQAPEVAS